MNNYLIIASDERSYRDLVNVVTELKNRDLPYFFLYNLSSTKSARASYKYQTNVSLGPDAPQYPSQTLGLNLPFKPDILLLTYENWEPEKTILWEFKQWGCFIACVENSSWMFNNIKTKIEIGSRKTFPTNCIDLFFDHSSWCLETKVAAGWHPSKSVITGSPRYDKLIMEQKDVPSDKIVIVYGDMDLEHHPHLAKIYHHLTSLCPSWTVLYKPHPMEFDPSHSQKLTLPVDLKGSNIIKTYGELLGLLPRASYHVGIFSSMLSLPLLLGKNIVTFPFSSLGVEDELDIELFKGPEFDFWRGVLKFEKFAGFRDYIGEDYIQETKDRNRQMEAIFTQSLIPYDETQSFLTQTSDNSSIVPYYDEYADGEASTRIVNFLENE